MELSGTGLQSGFSFWWETSTRHQACFCRCNLILLRQAYVYMIYVYNHGIHCIIFLECANLPLALDLLLHMWKPVLAFGDKVKGSRWCFQALARAGAGKRGSIDPKVGTVILGLFGSMMVQCLFFAARKMIQNLTWECSSSSYNIRYCCRVWWKDSRPTPDS